MNPTPIAAAPPFLPSDVVGVVFALFAAVYAFLWRRDRDPGIGWFALSWALCAAWFAGTPYAYNQPLSAFIQSGWTLLLFAMFVPLTLGMVHYVQAPPRLRSRFLALVLFAGAVYWVLPALVAFEGH